jgi:hypothetical protein
MVGNNPQKRLEIKKGQLWELWLVTPSAKTILGAFNSLEDLNQAQITLYRAWEKPRFPREAVPSSINQ